VGPLTTFTASSIYSVGSKDDDDDDELERILKEGVLD
jgi:hypothetical protein